MRREEGRAPWVAEVQSYAYQYAFTDLSAAATRNPSSRRFEAALRSRSAIRPHPPHTQVSPTGAGDVGRRLKRHAIFA